MSTVPHRAAYLALLCLPHDAVRHSIAIQSALATLRDHLAETDRQDPQALQDTFESVASLMMLPVRRAG